MKGFLLLTGLVMVIQLWGQTAADKKNVEKLCGCFDVVFKYAETFSPNPGYKFHDRDEISGGTELILPIEVSDTKMADIDTKIKAFVESFFGQEERAVAHQ